MRVHVRYATASDGGRIAFTATGAGPALVWMPPVPLRHLDLEWTLPEDRRFLERLGRGPHAELCAVRGVLTGAVLVALGSGGDARERSR